MVMFTYIPSSNSCRGLTQGLKPKPMVLTPMLYPMKPTARGKEQSVITCGFSSPIGELWVSRALKAASFSSKDHLPVHFNRGNGPGSLHFSSLKLGNLVHIEIRNNMNKNTNTPEKNRFLILSHRSFHSE